MYKRQTQLHVSTNEAPRLCYLLCATPAQESHSGGKGIIEAENGALVLAWATCAGGAVSLVFYVSVFVGWGGGLGYHSSSYLCECVCVTLCVCV